jgi:cytochrome c oxidase subunit 4
MSHFIPPLKYYVGTFVALLGLTVVTVGVAQFDLGSLNVPIAMAIAVLKASLVVGFFMGLHWDKGAGRIFFVSGIVAMLIFIAFTMTDVAFRGDIEPLEAGYHSIESPVKMSKHE